MAMEALHPHMVEEVILQLHQHPQVETVVHHPHIMIQHHQLHQLHQPHQPHQPHPHLLQVDTMEVAPQHLSL